MSDKQNINQDIEAIQLKLNQLIATYNELKKLNDSDAHSETLKEGFLLNARKNTEKILKYICKREGIVATSKPQNGKIDEGRIPMLNDYLFHLKGKKIIDGDIDHHLEIIKRWGNRNAHDISNDSSELNLIKASTIESVYDSSNYVKDWFFKTYLKGEYIDLTKNTYAKKEKVEELSQEEDERKKNFIKNPFNIPDLSILKQSKQYKNGIRRKKQRTSFIILLICCGIAYFGYHFFFEGSNKKAKNTTVTKTHMNKDQVYDFLIQYFNNSNDINSDAHEYFANKVDTFYFRYNVNPTEIDIIRQQNTGYLDNKNSIDKESLYSSSKNDSVTRWRFWTEYTCYRPTLKKFQNSKVQLEFGINTESKITSIKQIKKTKEKYTKEKPY
jgi:hypothetical protein